MPIARGQLAFTREEFLRRVRLTKAAMADRRVDTLFVTDHANLIWLTGYTAESAYVEQSLVISHDLEEPILCVRKMDFPSAVHQSFMDRERIMAFPESLIANADANGYDHMIAHLRDLGILKGTCGIEHGGLSALAAAYLERRLAPLTVVDATHLVTWLRLRKSDEEIALMRRAGVVADEAILAAARTIRVGSRESDAVAAAYSVMVKGGTQIAGSNFCTTPLTGAAHIQWSDHVYAPGSQVNIELGGAIERYCTGVMRTVHVGPPPDRLARIHDAEVAGLTAALEAAKTGNTCSDVASAFHAKLNAHGFEKESRCGYAIGINWTETTASLKVGDMTVLEPNMTFHLMLGNWVDEDFGYVISETFRVTDAGGDSMSSLPRQIFVADV